MQYTLMLWHADHVNFGRLLNLLESELSRCRTRLAGLRADARHHVLTHHSDELHHPKEDIVFARMKARDENAGPTINELTIQHAQLRDMGEAMVRALDDVLNGSITSRERIEAVTRAYVSALRAHMRTEESEILPRAGRLLSEGDWTEIDAAIANFDDPLFGSQAQDRYAGLREQINRQAQTSRATTR
jgi:hemerythrin-like domain-containing protein